ncbi:MAG: hypothetical protein AB8H47_26065 [Bacteroidia bacterium]
MQFQLKAPEGIEMKKYIFLLLFTSLLISACQHQTEPFDGPSLADRFGEFQLKTGIAASQNTVDFAADERVYFTAEFSKNVAWTLRITGKESGAIKLIEGFDNNLNEANATWNGTTTELPLFRAEDCLVELIVPEEDSLTSTVDISLAGSRNYEGSLVTDFETDLGGGLFFGNFEFELTGATGIRDDIPAGQGESFYFFEGTDNVVSNFFVGLIQIFPSVNGDTYFSMPSTVPEESYFNFFLYGDGTPHTIAVIQFFTDTNGDGSFTDGVDQSFQVEGDFPLSHRGWKAFNHTMADVGISEAQLSQLVAVQVLLISNMNAQPNPPQAVRFGLDYLTFTQDQPLAL